MCTQRPRYQPGKTVVNSSPDGEDAEAEGVAEAADADVPPADAVWLCEARHSATHAVHGHSYAGRG
ncbi:hypothetical protein GTZ89_11290, partial [Streptomyces sp. SID8382]|uniref:hypothetical protein n=1 Tax=Streptomyces malaysiensis TaxID=92644 RepID=UPI00136C055F